MRSTKGRTIFLLQNVRKQWFLRVVAAGNNEKIAAEESFDKPSGAQRAFMAEGRHQPFAKMVLRIPGQKDLIVRAGGVLPPSDATVEHDQLEVVRAAMRVRKAH